VPDQHAPTDRRRAEHLVKHLWSPRWLLCIAIVAICVLAPAGGASASDSAHTSAPGSALLPPVHGGPGFSWTPSATEPYAVCGRPTASHAACLAIIVPASARPRSSSTLQPTLTPTSPTLSGSGVGGGYDPADLRSAYDLPSESAGSGQTVAIVDAYDDPNAESDLAVYRTRYGISACTTANGCFRKVNQTGGTTYPTANAGWAVEISLDLDMVSAACPNCHILLVEASSNTNTDLYTAEDEAATLGATEISNSWAGAEFSGESSDDSFFDHPGVPITVAAGDEGYGVDYPASSPDVIAVGGTALTRASNTRGWSETAWSGTGSGCSVYEPKPAWQTDKGCADRTDNDVAAVASTETPVSIADSYKLPREFSVPEAGWTLVAGTSVASPLVAGTMALANAYTRSFPDAGALYEEAAQNGTGVLDNVVSGSNGSCGTYLCNAGSGYNGPTGLGSLYGAPVVLPPVQQEPQGSWVGTYGHGGYDLAGWDGSSDVSDLPGTSLSLTRGARWVWASSTSDVRALQSPDGLTRDAATYYSPTEVKLGLTFTHAYTGDLHLYAVDWDARGRRETISVGGQTVALSSDFSGGAWVSFPISVAAGETVSIVVTRTAGVNAVLSGVFLGDAGAPPALESPSAPQGSWVGAYGSAGYDLGAWDGSSDLTSLPSAAVSLVQGSRWVWASSTSDVRALESPSGLTREAATYYSATQLRLTLTFTSAYTGNLHLYALDWDKRGRRELISVGGQTADLSSDFSQGAWVTFPISVAAGGTVSIVVDRTAGVNAVLSGIFLGDAPPPPGPPVANAQGTLIPLYDNANPADWTQACSQTNGSGGGSLIIADVAEGSGPGSASVPAWANVIDNCYSYDRAKVIGYVWTDYGQASIASVESQVNAWYAYYPGAIAGIFFDGVSDDVPETTTSNQSFYRTLASYVHTHEGANDEVVFNFGANPGSDWMLNSTPANNANLLVTFEGSYDTPSEDPYTSWTQAPWEAGYPAHDFAALVYNAPDEPATPQPSSVCPALAKQNIGYVYVGTWYDQLPPYFGSFLTDTFGGDC
jgi:hypothetical protein